MHSRQALRQIQRVHREIQALKETGQKIQLKHRQARTDFLEDIVAEVEYLESEDAPLSS